MDNANFAIDAFLSRLADYSEKIQDYSQKATDILSSSLNTNIGGTPYDIVYEEDRVKLKHYRPFPTVKNPLKTPLLIVYALINRETMLDLQPERSVVQTMLKSGVDLYMIDWGYPTRKDKFLSIDDHVNGYLQNIVDFLREKYALPSINLMGVCMGGAFCAMFAALHPEKVKNLVTTVTPTNFDTDQGLLHVWMKSINVDQMISTYGNIPGDLMNLGFLLLNPARLMIDKYQGFLKHLDNKIFVENFVRMEKWIFDSPDIPGETFRQFIKDCYQKNLLIKSQMHIGGQRIDLGRITMPVLNIYGKFDHLVPPEAANKLPHVVGSRDTEDVMLNTGHIGIYVSSKYQREFAPKVVDWLKARDVSMPMKTAPPLPSASAIETPSTVERLAV